MDVNVAAAPSARALGQCSSLLHFSEARRLWERIQSQEHELMELRAEVASLRAQVPETPHASVQPSTPPNDIIDEHLMEDNIIGEHMMKEDDQDEVKSSPPFPPPDQHQNEIIGQHLMESPAKRARLL